MKIWFFTFLENLVFFYFVTIYPKIEVFIEITTFKTFLEPGLKLVTKYLVKSKKPKQIEQNMKTLSRNLLFSDKVKRNLLLQNFQLPLRKANFWMQDWKLACASTQFEIFFLFQDSPSY